MNHRRVIGSLACLLACGGQETTPQTQQATVTIVAPTATPTASATATASATTTSNAPDAGNIFGERINGEFGAAGGLGLSGTGEGGGSGDTIGLGGGRLTHTSIRQGTTTVNGRLPPEVIQRIVRQNFGRFQVCYDDGLRSTPTLQGRIAIKFVIDGTGALAKAEREASTDLPSAAVVDCIVRSFSSLSFPQPDGGGTVTVVYPLILTHDSQ